MRTRVVTLVWVPAGCGGTGAEQSDAGVPGNGTMCDPMAKFDVPVLLAGFNKPRVYGLPRLTADELELYLYLYDYDPITQQDLKTNIFRAQRSTVSQSFGAPIALTPVNTSAYELSPSVSSDGLMLFFASDRSKGSHLYVSTRTSRVSEFDAPSEVANVDSAMVTGNESDPFLTADGQELWFVSDPSKGPSEPTTSTARYGTDPASRMLPRSPRSTRMLTTNPPYSVRTN